MTSSVSDIQRVFGLQSEQQWVNKSSSSEQRIQVLQRFKRTLKAREEQAAAALYADLRKSEQAVGAEFNAIYAELDFAVANLDKWMQPTEYDPTPQYGAVAARTTYEARGIVLLFGPWNFPYSLVMQPLVSIIAAGNCALVKPNELAPNISRVTAEIIREVFDEKDVAVFQGGVDLANQLLELPVNHIFFTGSPAVGKKVMAAAAKNLASVTLELGGKNPVIVDSSANIQQTAAKIAAWRGLNSGQVCLCPENIWVPEDKLAEFNAVVAATYQAVYYRDGKLNLDGLGKIVDERNLQRVASYLDDAKSKGANVVFGGGIDSDAQAVHPTLLTDIPANAQILEEEVFGPILCVNTYKSIDDVIMTIRKQPKPLALYVFSENEDFVEDVLRRTSSGGVTVNDCLMHCVELQLPFGGVNNSGIGRYHGVHGFKELSHERSVLTMGG